MLSFQWEVLKLLVLQSSERCQGHCHQRWRSPPNGAEPSWGLGHRHWHGLLSPVWSLPAFESCWDHVVSQEWVWAGPGWSQLLIPHAGSWQNSSSQGPREVCSVYTQSFLRAHDSLSSRDWPVRQSCVFAAENKARAVCWGRAGPLKQPQTIRGA